MRRCRAAQAMVNRDCWRPGRTGEPNHGGGPRMTREPLACRTPCPDPQAQHPGCHPPQFQVERDSPGPIRGAHGARGDGTSLGRPTTPQRPLSAANRQEATTYRGPPPAVRATEPSAAAAPQPWTPPPVREASPPPPSAPEWPLARSTAALQHLGRSTAPGPPLCRSATRLLAVIPPLPP